KADALQQVMLLADVQIGTATVEKQIVEKANCAACHLGADSGKIYMAHIDPNATGTSLGNWAIDFEPVRTCKACHNNEGYAAYRGDINNPTGATTVRTPDNIVLRVHGVHMGEHLTNTFNTDPTTGNYKDYTGVLFPPNVKSCTVCHADDRWKTMPSVQACSACHDNTWFGAVAGMPKTFVAHPGGPQANDAACAACHQAEGTAKPSVAGSHKVIQVYDQVALSMTPPKSGKFYAAGDKPVVTVVVKDAKGNPIDHTKVDTTNFGTANLYVYGPRYESKPVLTNAAKNRNSKASASATSSIPASGTPTKGWTFAAGDTFKIAVHGGAIQELAALAGLQTPDQVAAWLKASLKDVTVTANNTAGSVNIRSNLQGDNSKFAIYNSAVTTIMGWKPVGLNIIEHGKVVGQTVGTTMEPFVVIGAASNAANDLRKQSSATAYADPAVTRTAANITYQLDDMAGLKAGTYMVYMYTLPVAGKFTDMSSTAFGLITFQVGTETPELKVATNCTDCHKSTIWHLDEGPIHAEPFDTDWCKACHDYNRSGTGEGFSRTGGTSTSGWAGYGSKPIVARVHGVHRGAYLHRPDEVYAGNPNVFAEVIFPQDIRNCTKCHDPKTTSGTWKTEPSRLACLACHDSDEAKAHGNVMTVLPSPDYDPYGAQAVETCKLCHGAGRDFSPDKVHSISSPFHPPYLREPKLEE
ncbi:MAG: cytochrome c3 family protein, partial [Dehalococcoidia bacterium]|nr:cytochrome c3 family protein [Dehalococcoidia bacterium]